MNFFLISKKNNNNFVRTINQATSERSSSELQASFFTPHLGRSEWRSAELALGMVYDNSLSTLYFVFRFLYKTQKVNFHVNAYRFGGNDLQQCQAVDLSRLMVCVMWTTTKKFPISQMKTQIDSCTMGYYRDRRNH